MPPNPKNSWERNPFECGDTNNSYLDMLSDLTYDEDRNERATDRINWYSRIGTKPWTGSKILTSRRLTSVEFFMGLLVLVLIHISKIVDNQF